MTDQTRDAFVNGLRRAAAAWFAERGYQVDPKHPYCLADHDDWPQNIIDKKVVEYVEHWRDKRRLCTGKEPPLHKYLHHGLSSQAMVLNLVGPLIVGNDLSPLLSVLEAHGMSHLDGHVTPVLEYEDISVFREVGHQPTSLDLVLKDQSGPRVFVEAKLSEPGFGGCSVHHRGACDGQNPVSDLSRCYLHQKKKRLYWKLLDEQGFLDGPIADDPFCVLAEHYQFFRELCFAIHFGGRFVVLADERNPSFFGSDAATDHGLIGSLLRMVPAGLHAQVSQVSVQQVVAAIKGMGRPPWISEFEAKYGLGDSV